MTILKLLRSGGEKYLQYHSNICVSPFANDYNGEWYTRVFHVADYVCTRSRTRVHSKYGVTCANYNDKCELMEERSSRVIIKD